MVGTDVTEEHRRNLTDRALRRIASASAAGDSLGSILDLLAGAVHDLFGAEQAGVAQFTTDGRVEIVAATPTPLQAGDGANPFPEGSAVDAVRTAGTPQIVRRPGPSSGAAPIFVNGRLWGAVEFGVRDPDMLDSDVLKRLGRFTDAAASSISSAAAWRTLTEQAIVDALTGLPNRRAFDAELDRACQAAARHDGVLSLVILDIDHFKRVNDTFGHPAGDRVLALASARMAQVVRSDEFLARFGGEEFVLIIPGADEHDAVAAAERLRAAIAAGTGDGPPITASAGVGTCVGDVGQDALVKMADQCLYEAKRGGRNSVRSQTRRPSAPGITPRGGA